MTINLTVPTVSNSAELKPRISVIGVGGAGGNAVNNMIHSGLEGVEFIVANSDAQALGHSACERRIQMGTEVTQGLGAGSNPDIGRAAAEESLEEILAHMRDSNMVFVTAGLGGGTGTGAAPVIARAAREYGILTVGVVTKPFQFEGANRMKIAEAGLEELQQYVDTLLIIPNQNLFRVANEKTTFADAFKMADDVLYSGVRGVTDLMVMPGLINLDFADIKAVMSEMGKAMMGTGEAEGERRAVEAAEAAIANPLLDDTSMSGARGVLINITAGSDITLFEVDEAANRIRDEVADDANIIFGSTFEESLEGRVRVSVVATGIESIVGVQPRPVVRQVTDATEKPGAIPALAPKLPEPVQQKTVAEAAPAAKPAGFFIPSTPAPTPEPVAEAEDEQQVDLEEAVAEAIATEEVQPAAAPEPVEVRADEDVFIPSAPAEVEAKSDLVKTADPFAEADMINAGSKREEQKPAKKSGLNLFERVTGITRGEKKPEWKERILPPPVTPAPPECREEPQIAAVVPLPEPKPVKEPVAESAPAAEAAPEPEVQPVEPAVAVADPAPEAVDETPPAMSEPAAEVAVKPAPQPAPESVAESAPEPAEKPDSAPQSLLEDEQPGSPIMGPQEDEDLLDIPAFLRRQAN